jgi:hypothetical protein
MAGERDAHKFLSLALKWPNGEGNDRPGAELNPRKTNHYRFGPIDLKAVPQVSDHRPALYQATGATTSRTNRRLSLFRKRGVFDDDHTAAMASRAFAAGWHGLEIFRRHFFPTSINSLFSASLRERQEYAIWLAGRRPAFIAGMVRGSASRGGFFDRNESPSRSLSPGAPSSRQC